MRALDLVFPAKGRSLARALPPLLVVVFLGANDAVAPGAYFVWIWDPTPMSPECVHLLTGSNLNPYDAWAAPSWL